MEITYKKYDNYYIFSDEPNTKVFLGDIPPEDYIHDQVHQAKRRASCYHYEIATGKKVSQEEAYEKSWEKEELIWHGEDLTHEHDSIKNYTYGYKCDYDFQRKTFLTTMGGTNGNFKYNSKDPKMKRLAESEFFGYTLDLYDLMQKKHREEREEFERLNPSITNLMMIGGRDPFYVDYDHNEITCEQHTALMKEKYGEDVFEKEAERLEKETSPEVKEIVKQILAGR